jgi:hypothetical protein
MGGFKPVPLDDLPMPQAAAPVQYQPAQLAEPPARNPNDNPGVGYMGTGGKIADIASNFLNGWMQGKQKAEEKKIANASQEMQGLHYGFQIAQANAQSVANDPKATPEQKAQAEQARQAAWKAYLDGAEKYVQPPKGGSKSGGQGGKKDGGGIKAHLKQAFGAEDPHLYAQAGLGLLRKTGPPPLAQPSPQDQMAKMEYDDKKRINDATEEAASALAKLNDARAKGASPEDIAKLESSYKQAQENVKTQWERVKPPEKESQIRTVTTGQPIPGEMIGRPKNTFWRPNVDGQGATVGYVEVGPPNAKETVGEKTEKDLKAEYKGLHPELNDKQVDDWYAKNHTKQFEQKGQPTVTSSTQEDETGVQHKTTTIRGHGGAGASSLSPTPSQGPSGTKQSGTKEPPKTNWGVPPAEQKEIIKRQKDAGDASKSYEEAQRIMARIAKNPSAPSVGTDDMSLLVLWASGAHSVGMRPTKSLLDEAQSSRPLPGKLEVTFQGNLVSGAKLTAAQRYAIVSTLQDKEKVAKDALYEDKARYGQMKKVQNNQDGTVNYVSNEDYAKWTDDQKKAYTVIPVD